MNSYQNTAVKLSVMRRVIIYGVLFFILCVAQTSFFGQLSFLSVVPNLALGGVAAVALLDEERCAIVCGIAAGFLADAIGGSGISLSPIIFMLVAIICAEISCINPQSFEKHINFVYAFNFINNITKHKIFILKI